MLDRLADHVLAEGLNGSSLRALAKGAGTSDRMLLYYFEDKDALLTATLTHLAARFTALVEAATSPHPVCPDALASRIGDAVLSPTLWPYGRLWLDLAARASFGDATCRTVGREITRTLLDWGASQIDLPENARADAALHVLARLESALMLNAVGMARTARRLL